MGRVMIYTRVANPEQSSAKLDNQMTQCMKFAKDNDKDVVRVYTDVISGRQTSNRFEELLDDMIEQKVDDLIVQNWSRVSRNALEVIEINKMFSEKGKCIISVEDEF